jgi:hypothetical protein
LTTVSSRTGAFRQVLSRGTVGGEKLSDCLKPVFERLAGAKTAWSPGTTLPHIVGTENGVDYLDSPLGKMANEPSEKEIQQAVEQLPSKLMQKFRESS